MLAFILLFVLALVGADTTSAASFAPEDVASTNSDAHWASSNTTAPSEQQHNNTGPGDGCFTILGIVSKQLPALNRSLAELSDVLAQNPAQSRMLAPIRELVDYMEFVQHSPAYSLRRTVPNKALQHMGEAATLIKNIIGQTRLTSDSAAMEAMQSILASVLTVNEYLLVHERYHHHHHHHNNFNMDEVDKEMLEEAGSGSGDWVPADDADAEDKAENNEEERVLVRFHRTDPTNVLKNGHEVNRRVANDFLHSRPHTQAECCMDDCQFDDCCPDCCICCPKCMEPPAGELPPVVPPANAA